MKNDLKGIEKNQHCKTVFILYNCMMKKKKEKKQKREDYEFLCQNVVFFPLVQLVFYQRSNKNEEQVCSSEIIKFPYSSAKYLFIFFPVKIRLSLFCYFSFYNLSSMTTIVLDTHTHTHTHTGAHSRGKRRSKNKKKKN